MPEVITAQNIPFRVLRPLHRTLQEVTITALQTIENPPTQLLAEVYGGMMVSRQLKNPTRHVLLGHILAWYELCGQVCNALPEGAMKTAVIAFLGNLTWIDEQIQSMKKAQTNV